MIHFRAGFFRQKIRDVLDKGSGAVDVQTLQAVADAEHGLAQTVGIVEQKMVDVVAARVSGGGMGRARGVEPRRIDVGFASGQQYAVAALDYFADFVWGAIQRNANRFASGQRDGALVLRNRPLGILGVGEVWQGDGNAGRHGLDCSAMARLVCRATKTSRALPGGRARAPVST